MFVDRNGNSEDWQDMYVERNGAGRIVGAWQDRQREGQELLPINDAALQAFLATPVGRWDVPGGDGGRWG